MPTASIIICTRNRVDALSLTLESLRRTAIPPGICTELIVVDNGSDDGTRDLVRGFHSEGISARHVYETGSGKGFAYNRGIAESEGDILIWTDDDVRLPEEWLEGMCEPILCGRAEAVAGGVRVAPHLERPWMTTVHRNYLAGTDALDPADPFCMIGANMAFSRRVLERVPAFDTELGPGALGFCDETLFSMQLKASGYKIVSRFDVAVEHHFDPSRLSYEAMGDRMRKEGRSLAYIAHHWQHVEIRAPNLKAWKRTVRLLTMKAASGRVTPPSEGMPDWEMRLICDIAFYRAFAMERKRPRNYELKGPVKLA